MDETKKKRRDWGGDFERILREALKKMPDLRLQKRNPGIAGGRHVGKGMMVGRATGSAGLDFEGHIAAEPWPCPVLIEAKAVKGRRLAASAFQPGQLERLHEAHKNGCVALALVAQHDDNGWVAAWAVHAPALPNPKKLGQAVSVVIGGEGDGRKHWHPVSGLSRALPAGVHQGFGAEGLRGPANLDDVVHYHRATIAKVGL